MCDVLSAGKVSASLLAELLGRLPALPADVIVGAKPGEDAAVIDLGDRFLVLAMDPVTLSAEPGRYVAQVNANDIAVTGAEPRWLLVSIVLPVGSSEDVLRSIMDDLRQSCSRLGVALIGGHTEISPAVNRPIIVACMAGDATSERLVRSEARPGDALLLITPVAVEGTAILAQEYGELLRQRGVPPASVRRASQLFDDPGISILPGVRSLLDITHPHAMHDPTEGGLLGAAREMALASKVGLWLDANAVPILPLCREICGALDLDPLALLASGSVLVALDPEAIVPALHGLSRVGIEAAVIGKFQLPENGLGMLRDGLEGPLPEVPRDELARWEERG